MATTTPKPAAYTVTTYDKCLGYTFIFHVFFSFFLQTQLYGVLVASYNLLWVCTCSLLLSAYGILTNSPETAAIGMISVGIGHMAWSLDSISLILFNDTLFDIATWNCLTGEFSWNNFYSQSHHLWFIPSMIIYLRSKDVTLR
jgi:hypothetical protein